ncbi:hypothetical protein [Klebsiella variicola]|uniref:hypothetical protein n=1 Tax=Klebsiella variicola TaxID=244366 RepID=UPI000D74936C|nr:hypothetical protein [Klebsiella variicola]PXM42804.1 hypothetical protein DMT39_13405 [Klebsiella variicola]HBZ7769375.1 hypothetical protein [Klebsiella variicola subsp. variicola]HBZ7806056.1 hypothetical protein [Klebsiella variicola subsp. variicola]
MKINLFNLFRKKNRLQDDFPHAQFMALPEEGGYPLFFSLDKSNVYAHSACFMIKPEDILVIEYLIELFFYREVKISEVKEKVSDHNKVLVCYKFKEFEQDIVRLITNDNEFINCLCEKGLEPPEPECAFPDKDFGAYGSLQGDMEFWWNVYWKPFWESLREEERKQYLERSNLSIGTIEFLEHRR